MFFVVSSYTNISSNKPEWNVAVFEKRTQAENSWHAAVVAGQEAYLFANTSGAINEPGIRDAVVRRMALCLEWTRELGKIGVIQEGEGSSVSIAYMMKELLQIIFGPDAVEEIWNEAKAKEQEIIDEDRHSRPTRMVTRQEKNR